MLDRVRVLFSPWQFWSALCKKPAKDNRFEAQPLIKGQSTKGNGSSAATAMQLSRPLHHPEPAKRNMTSPSRPPWRSVALAPGFPRSDWRILLRQFGVLLPDSTQWELVRDAADLAQPVMNALVRYGANCKNLYTDDTSIQMIE